MKRTRTAKSEERRAPLKEMPDELAMEKDFTMKEAADSTPSIPSELVSEKHNHLVRRHDLYMAAAPMESIPGASNKMRMQHLRFEANSIVNVLSVKKDVLRNENTVMAVLHVRTKEELEKLTCSPLKIEGKDVSLRIFTPNVEGSNLFPVKVTGIPKKICKSEIIRVLGRFGQVATVHTMDRSHTKWAIVSYTTHEAAKMLIEQKYFFLGSARVRVWHPDIDTAIEMKKETQFSLRLVGIPSGTTEEQLSVLSEAGATHWSVIRSRTTGALTREVRVYFSNEESSNLARRHFFRIRGFPTFWAVKDQHPCYYCGRTDHRISECNSAPKQNRKPKVDTRSSPPPQRKSAHARPGVSYASAASQSISSTPAPQSNPKAAYPGSAVENKSEITSLSASLDKVHEILKELTSLVQVLVPCVIPLIPTTQKPESQNIQPSESKDDKMEIVPEQLPESECSECPTEKSASCQIVAQVPNEQTMHHLVNSMTQFGSILTSLMKQVTDLSNRLETMECSTKSGRAVLSNNQPPVQQVQKNRDPSHFEIVN